MRLFLRYSYHLVIGALCDLLLKVPSLSIKRTIQLYSVRAEHTTRTLQLLKQSLLEDLDE